MSVLGAEFTRITNIMPSRFTVVDDPLYKAREAVEHMFDLSQEAAMSTVRSGSNVTAHALRWINETVEWPARVVFFFAMCSVCVGVISRSVLARRLVRAHCLRCGFDGLGGDQKKKL